LFFAVLWAGFKICPAERDLARLVGKEVKSKSQYFPCRAKEKKVLLSNKRENTLDKSRDFLALLSQAGNGGGLFYSQAKHSSRKPVQLSINELTEGYHDLVGRCCKSYFARESTVTLEGNHSRKSRS
jgi:hypothetical protein